MSTRLAVSLLVCLATTVAPMSAEETDKLAASKLVTKAEMQAIMGELRGEATCGTGVRSGEVTCNYDNMSGAWVKIRLYKQDADQFAFQKNMLPNKCTSLPKLGADAFWTKAGSDAQVYARKGNTTLEVDSSGGSAFAIATAEKAYARLK